MPNVIKLGNLTGWECFCINFLLHCRLNGRLRPVPVGRNANKWKEGDDTTAVENDHDSILLRGGCTRVETEEG